MTDKFKAECEQSLRNALEMGRAFDAIFGAAFPTLKPETKPSAAFRFLTQSEFDALTPAERATYAAEVKREHKRMEAYDRAVKGDRCEVRAEFRGENVSGQDIRHDADDLAGE